MNIKRKVRFSFCKVIKGKISLKIKTIQKKS